MNIDAVLSGQAGLAGVQSILHGPLMRDVLQRELGALLTDGNLVRSLRLRRAKYKPGRKLTAYYEVGLNHGQEESVWPIAVTWTPPGTDTWQDAKPILLHRQAEICRQGLAVPFRQLMTEAPAWNMGIQVYPLDGHFPQLTRMTSPQYVRDMLAPYDDRWSQTEALPGDVSNPDYSITPIRYRPRQRHVLRYSPVSKTDRAKKNGGTSPSRKTFFAKLYNSEQGAQTYQIVTQVADWFEQRGLGITAMRPLAYVAADRTILYPHLAGTPLSHSLQYSNGEAGRHLWQAGFALRTLHEGSGALSTKRGLANELKTHTFSKEVRLVTRASEHIHALLPAIGNKIDQILDRAQALYASLPPASLTFTHKDFKADHIWITPAGLTLIDFDSCCLADAALDVGKFLADLQWWHGLRYRPNLAKAQACFLEGYDNGKLSGRADLRPIHSRLYEVLWLVKTSVRRFRLFAPGWEHQTEQAIHRAEETLNRINVEEA